MRFVVGSITLLFLLVVFVMIAAAPGVRERDAERGGQPADQQGQQQGQ